jgi:hypothetical protein
LQIINCFKKSSEDGSLKKVLKISDEICDLIINLKDGDSLMKRPFMLEGKRYDDGEM